MNRISVHNSFLKQIEDQTQIFTDELTNKKYIYVNKKNNKPSKRITNNKNQYIIYIPEKPVYDWSMAEEFINSDILFNLYFIS